MIKKKLEFREDENGCFIVTSHRPNSDGYCFFRKDKIQKRAHRHIYEECFGEIAEGLVVRHKCDIRNCINPEHMELGTTQENTADRDSKGRTARGEKHGSSKLKKIQVDEIRSVYLPCTRGEFSKTALAKKYGVSEKNIRNIVNKKQWKEIV